jgi:uncharacterized protein YraI
MKRFKVLSALGAVLALVPGIAAAQWDGYAAKPLNLRAGPAMEYPLVAQVPAGVSISVQGCLSDYQWCDVVAGPDRGWAYANNIYYPYQGANVPIRSYGPMIGIGIVAFALGSYWDQHYRGHAWYPQRQHWIDRSRPEFGPGGHRLPYEPGFGPGGHRPPHGPGFGTGGHRPPDGPLGGPRGHRPPDGPIGGLRGHRPPDGPIGGPRGHRPPDAAVRGPAGHRPPEHRPDLR